MWSTGPDKGNRYSNVLVVTCRICSTHFPLLLLLLLVCRRLLSTPGGHLCMQTLSHVNPTKEPTALYIPPLINAIKYSTQYIQDNERDVSLQTAELRMHAASKKLHDSMTLSQEVMTRNTRMYWIVFTFIFTFFISRVGALTGKVTRTVAAIANHFDTAAGPSKAWLGFQSGMLINDGMM